MGRKVPDMQVLCIFVAMRYVVWFLLGLMAAPAGLQAQSKRGGFRQVEPVTRTLTLQLGIGGSLLQPAGQLSLVQPLRRIRIEKAGRMGYPKVRYGQTYQFLAGTYFYHLGVQHNVTLAYGRGRILRERPHWQNGPFAGIGGGVYLLDQPLNRINAAGQVETVSSLRLQAALVAGYTWQHMGQTSSFGWHFRPMIWLYTPVNSFVVPRPMLETGISWKIK